jgi:hypothetical protein
MFMKIKFNVYQEARNCNNRHLVGIVTIYRHSLIVLFYLSVVLCQSVGILTTRQHNGMQSFYISL